MFSIFKHLYAYILNLILFNVIFHQNFQQWSISTSLRRNSAMCVYSTMYVTYVRFSFFYFGFLIRYRSVYNGLLTLISIGRYTLRHSALWYSIAIKIRHSCYSSYFRCLITKSSVVYSFRIKNVSNRTATWSKKAYVSIYYRSIRYTIWLNYILVRFSHY